MGKCQVCDAPIEDGRLNCGSHSHVRKSSVALVKYIIRQNGRIGSGAGIQAIADEFGVSLCTVYRNLKAEGFRSWRGWERRK